MRFCRATIGSQSKQPTENRAADPKFEPYKGKIRKPGTGCIYQINDNLWEGSYFPRLPNGKRKKHNIYATTREECEEKLAEMIERVKKEIRDEKERRKKEDDIF